MWLNQEKKRFLVCCSFHVKLLQLAADVFKSRENGHLYYSFPDMPFALSDKLLWIGVNDLRWFLSLTNDIIQRF